MGWDRVANEWNWKLIGIQRDRKKKRGKHNIFGNNQKITTNAKKRTRGSSEDRRAVK